MKSAIFAAVLVTLGCFSLPVLAQQQDLQDVMNAANALSARENELLSKKDAAGIASLFTSDGLLVMLAPQFAFKPGRDAIQKHYQGIIDAGATSIMTRYNSSKRTHKISTRFEMTKAEIDALPSTEQRFSRQGP
jgi:ketosteroid isomerase-like protein